MPVDARNALVATEQCSLKTFCLIWRHSVRRSDCALHAPDRVYRISTVHDARRLAQFTDVVLFLLTVLRRGRNIALSSSNSHGKRLCCARALRPLPFAADVRQIPRCQQQALSNVCQSGITPELLLAGGALRIIIVAARYKQEESCYIWRTTIVAVEPRDQVRHLVRCESRNPHRSDENPPRLKDVSSRPYIAVRPIIYPLHNSREPASRVKVHLHRRRRIEHCIAELVQRIHGHRHSRPRHTITRVHQAPIIRALHARSTQYVLHNPCISTTEVLREQMILFWRGCRHHLLLNESKEWTLTLQLAPPPGRRRRRRSLSPSLFSFYTSQFFKGNKKTEKEKEREAEGEAERERERQSVHE